MRAANSRARRGTATVEFAIATLILVPLAMYAIWVGEVFFVGMKALEAESYALWGVTAVRTDDYRGRNPSVPAQRITQVSTASENRTLDLLGDLRTDLDDTGGFSGIALNAQLADVDCVRVSGARQTYDQTFTQARGFSTNLLRRTFPDPGLIACRARVNVQSTIFPRRLFPERSNVDMLRVLDFTLCGAGVGPDGCGGSGVPVLVGDWSLTRSNANRVGTQQNRHYFNLAQSVFLAGKVEPAPTVKCGSAANPGDTCEGAIGTHQLREWWQVHHGNDVGNMESRANPSVFRLAFAARVAEAPAIDIDDGRGGLATTRYHPTPFDDVGDSQFLPSGYAWSTRTNDSYLGHPDPNFNAP